MKMKDVTQALKALGWSIYTDEVGDKSAHYVLHDRIVQIIYGVDKIREQQKFSAMLSLSTNDFSNACRIICGDCQGYSPLIRAWNGIKISAPEILEEHSRQASDQATKWAKEQNLDTALEEHRNLPTDAPGVRPIWHLAALALLGDAEKLKYYQESFEAGSRLGFVPYVSKDYIDRAVKLTEERTCT